MNILPVQKLRLWYSVQDERYKLFFLYAVKVVFFYFLFETIIAAYVGLVTPGGSMQSSFLMNLNFLDSMAMTIVWGAYYLLSGLQFDVFIHGNVIGVVGTGGVGVGYYCIGYYVWMTIAVLVGCFPGNWKTKIIFIGTSIILIHFVNIIRISALAILAQYDVDLESHHIIYNFVIYMFTVLLFLIYVERFSDMKKFSGARF